METQITVTRRGISATAELHEDTLVDQDALQELAYRLIAETENKRDEQNRSIKKD